MWAGSRSRDDRGSHYQGRLAHRRGCFPVSTGPIILAGSTAKPAFKAHGAAALAHTWCVLASRQGRPRQLPWRVGGQARLFPLARWGQTCARVLACNCVPKYLVQVCRDILSLMRCCAEVPQMVQLHFPAQGYSMRCASVCHAEVGMLALSMQGFSCWQFAMNVSYPRRWIQKP